MAHKERTKATWRDVDAMLHVNNAVYFTWMETARVEYYLRVRKSRTIASFDIILAHAACDFRRGVRHGEEVVVRVWPSRVGTTSFDLAYRMTVGKEVVATGKTVQVYYDYKAGEKRALPAELRQALERDMEPVA